MSTKIQYELTPPGLTLEDQYRHFRVESREGARFFTGEYESLDKAAEVLDRHASEEGFRWGRILGFNDPRSRNSWTNPRDFTVIGWIGRTPPIGHFDFPDWNS